MPRRSLALLASTGALLALLPVVLPTASASPVAQVTSFAADGLAELGPLPRRELRASGRTTSATVAPSAGLRAAQAAAEPTAQFVVTYTGFTAAQQAAFQQAVDTWSHLVVSSVPILVDARISALEPGVLGSAGPANAFRSGGSYYAVALSNALAGRDLDPQRPDVFADFTDDASLLYFGNDGRPPAGTYDFPTVVLHEIGHGLGFLGGMEVVNGVGTYDPGSSTPTPFSWDRLAAQRTSTGFTPLLDYPRGSAALAQALQGGEVFWRGASGSATTGTSPELYAPARWEPGSSYGHLDEAVFAPGTPSALMTPFLDRQEVLRDPGPVSLGILEDTGWRLSAAADPTPTSSPSPSPSASFAPTPQPSSSPVTQPGSRFTALAPRRLLDTRDGTGARVGRVGAGGVVDLTVTGGDVPSGATAVVLNVTGVSATTSTDVRAYPVLGGGAVPEVSNLNLAAGQTRANLVTVAVGELGRVRLRNTSGSVHLLADLAGFYAPSAASGFFPLDPERVLDTRTRTGATTVGPGQVLDLRVAGTGSVPATARAVVLGVTAVGATRSTDVRVYPTRTGDATVPQVSSLNAAPGGPVPNLVVVQVGDGGSVRLRNTSGTVSLLADLYGYYDPARGSLFRPLTPSRLLDTRPSRPGPRSVVDVATAGRGGVPEGATAVALNVTGVGAAASTDVRVYPTPLSGSAPVPTVSTLNLVTGQTAADAALVRTGNGGSVRLYNNSGTVALIVDVAGWFGP